MPRSFFGGYSVQAVVHPCTLEQDEAVGSNLRLSERYGLLFFQQGTAYCTVGSRQWDSGSPKAVFVAFQLDSWSLFLFGEGLQLHSWSVSMSSNQLEDFSKPEAMPFSRCTSFQTPSTRQPLNSPTP